MQSTYHAHATSLCEGEARLVLSVERGVAARFEDLMV